MKIRNEKTFKLTGGYSVVCRSENTRYGFRHLASLRNSAFEEVAKSKVSYSNRTWESFPYETVIRQALAQHFEKRVVDSMMEKLSAEARGEVDRTFASVAAIAKLGELMTDNKVQANDWKVRMLKAGLPGLDIPDDWDSLTEDEKQKRLDSVIAFASKKEATNATS